MALFIMATCPTSEKPDHEKRNPSPTLMKHSTQREKQLGYDLDDTETKRKNWTSRIDNFVC